MIITKELADIIAKEVEEITKIYFTVMDSRGYIFACTDKSREGTRHEGIDVMRENNLKELFVDYDGQYPGCTKGIINTLLFSNKVIGYIGLGGVPEEMVNYIRILKKMIEVIIKEKFDTFIRSEEELRAELLVRNILGFANENDMKLDAVQGLRENKMRENNLFIVACIIYENQYEDKITSKAITDQIFSFFIDKRVLSCNIDKIDILISDYSEKEVLILLETIESAMYRFFNLKLSICLSKPAKLSDLPQRYAESQSYIQYMQNKKIKGIQYYDPRNIEFLCMQIPEYHVQNLWIGYTK